MIDNAVASSSATLDLKVQAKPGSKADKADKSSENHKKTAFQDALKAHGHGRPEKGKIGESDDPPANLELDREDMTGETDQVTTKPVKTRIPRVHFDNAQQVDDNAAPDLADPADKPAEPKSHAMDERRQTLAKEGLRLGELVAEKAQQLKGDEVSTEAADTISKKPVHSHRAKSDDKEIAATTDDRPAAPARDVLSLLDDKAHGSGPSDGVLITREPPRSALEAADGDTGADNTQRYRISRADGRGGMVELEGRDRAGDADRAGAPQKAGVQDVTVLEQRRFLAPSEQGNLQSVIQAISGDAEWQVAMQPGSELANAAAQAGAGKVVNTLKIQMHPIELGLVTATMRLQGDELTVELKVHTGVAYKQLRDDQSQIIESLKAQGFNVDQVSVVFAPDRGEQTSGQQAQTNGQGAGFAQQQQQARDGSQGNGPGRPARIAAQERAGGNGTEQAENQIDASSGGRGTGGRSQSVWL